MTSDQQNEKNSTSKQLRLDKTSRVRLFPLLKPQPAMIFIISLLSFRTKLGRLHALFLSPGDPARHIFSAHVVEIGANLLGGLPQPPHLSDIPAIDPKYVDSWRSFSG